MSFNMGVAGVPYWQLSSFYFFYFAFIGALSPFFGLYLSDIGLSAYAIGLVNAVLISTKIVAPNLWGWLCDRTGKRLRIIALGSCLSTIFFSGLLFWQSLAAIVLITFCYGFFWNAVLSQFDAVTIQYLKEQSHRYSHIRVWGSIGFIIAVSVLGILFDYISIQYLIPIAWVLLLLSWVTCLLIKEPPIQENVPHSAHWVNLFKRPEVIVFFAATFLLQFSFGAYYTFFSLYLESYDYSRTSIGLLWALGVVAEVVLFLFIHRLMPKVGVAYLLFWSLLLTALRWWLIVFFADSFWLVVITQCIHALSFGATHAASIELIRLFFKGKNIGQGNALYSAITFGLGGAAGAMSSGFLWEINPQLLFAVSGSAVLLAAFIVRFWLCKKTLTE